MHQSHAVDAADAARIDRIMADLTRNKITPGDAVQHVVRGLAINGLIRAIEQDRPDVSKVREMLVAISKTGKPTAKQQAQIEAAINQYTDNMGLADFRAWQQDNPKASQELRDAMSFRLEREYKRVAARLLDRPSDDSPIIEGPHRYCPDCGSLASEGDKREWGCECCGWVHIEEVDDPENEERWDEFTGPMKGGV